MVHDSWRGVQENPGKLEKKAMKLSKFQRRKQRKMQNCHTTERADFRFATPCCISCWKCRNHSRTWWTIMTLWDSHFPFLSRQSNSVTSEDKFMLLVLLLLPCNLERLFYSRKTWRYYPCENPSTASCLHVEKIQCLSVGQAETLPTPDSPAKPPVAWQHFMSAVWLNFFGLQNRWDHWVLLCTIVISTVIITVIKS